MRVFDRAALNALTEKAKSSPRLRMNLNIHQGDDAPCHRLFNAVEPDTYVSPHRHLDPFKGETLVAVRGRVGVLKFSPEGEIVEKVVLDPAGEVMAVDIAPGEWHGAVSLESGSIFFEAKAGPYVPITAAEIAPWAPADGTPEAAGYVAKLRELFV